MSKKITLTVFATLSLMILVALPVSVTAATISNAIDDDSITIDANIDDWSAIASLGYDGAALPNVNTQADYLEGWLAHDASSLYIAYRNNGDIITSAWWSWQVYIDTDTSTSTGYKNIDGLGAEYLLQGASVYKYTGSGTNWSWQNIGSATNAVNGALAEFKIPRSMLSNPTEFRTVFKARNSAFTGRYSVADIDTYPKASSALTLHDDLLFRQSAIWMEAGGTQSMRLASDAAQGSTTLEMASAYPLIDDQLITYLASNDEYYTAHVKSTNGSTITLNKPLASAISAGKTIWNFYANGSHPNEFGYRAIADFAIRKIGINNLNTGRHVLLGDSWFDSPGVSERLEARLSDATVINKGLGGNTSTNLLNRFDTDVARQNPDFVWVIAGVNDYHQDVPTATYLSSMQAIIGKINSIGATGVIFDSPVGQLFYGSDERRQLSHRYSEGLSGGGVGGFVDYTLGAVVPLPETGDVSNPKSINIDGDLDDWRELQSFGRDGDDINIAGARADILEGWMAHDEAKFYLAYRNDGEIVRGTWWPWQIYLDTDNNEETGFKAGNGVGANYIIQGSGLYRYIGSGADWAWQYVASADFKINNDVAELAFSRAAIGNPSSVSAIMKARNGIFTGNYSQAAMDSYPNVGSDHLNYKFGDVLSRDSVSNRVDDFSIDLDGNVNDWTAVTSFGTDPDDITDANQQADWLEAWAAHDNNNLYFAYQNDGDISAVAWPYQVYIDIDNNPDTGYQVTGGIGAEFILEGKNLRRYSGSGSNWSWDTLAVTGSATDGAYSEIAIPRSVLEGVSDFRVIFKANNQPFTGNFAPSGVDYFPDNAVSSDDGYFSYSMQ